MYVNADRQSNACGGQVRHGTHLSALLSQLYANNFYGSIPTELGQLKTLESLDVHDNDLTGRMPRQVCQLRKHKLKELVADCLGPNPEVQCDCCTVCCKGLPEMKCVDVATGREVRLDMTKKQQ